MGNCKFNPEWEKEFPWLKRVLEDKHRGWCKSCQMSISVKKGRTDVDKHGKTPSHIKKEKSDNSPNPITNATNKQLTIGESIEKAQAIQTKERKAKDAALKFEFGLSVRAANHNISGTFVDCVVDLVTKTIKDSATVKEIKMHQGKCSYVLHEAIAPALRAKVIACMTKWPFSLNYDESVVNKKAQLALNASFRNEKNLIQKANIASIELTQSATGKYVSDKTYEALEADDIPTKNQVSDQTDGCAVMLGRFQGCHEYAKKVVPTLPDLGGCGCHDPCNCIKNGLAAMMPEMTQLYKALWANLEKHSIVKNRQFKEVGADLGMVVKQVPRFLDVRFRYVALLAKYMEENDRPLYVYYSELLKQAQGGKKISETEAIILNIFLGSYLEVRLTNLFLIDVCQPFLDYIDFFESREVRCHLRHPKMAMLLADHMGKFLKENVAVLTPAQLLKVDLSSSNVLPLKKIILGVGVDRLLAVMKMTTDSPELKPFMDSVIRFYVKSTTVMVKYFTAPLQSKILRSLSILHPMDKKLPLDEARETWKFLGKSFPNIVDDQELNHILVSELPRYAGLEDPVEQIAIDEWWARVAEVEICGEKHFANLTRLALGLCTIYNSSSEAERDISKLNQIFAGDKKSNMNQSTVQDKMTVQAAVSEEGKCCKRCLENEKKRDDKKKKGERVGRRRVDHCHCGFIDPSDELLADLRNSGPAQRHSLKVNRNKNNNLNENDDAIGDIKRKEDEVKAKEDLRKEVAKLARKVKDNCNKVSETSKSVSKSKSVAKKRTSKANIEKVDIVSKRPRLGFLDQFKK